MRINLYIHFGLLLSLLGTQEVGAQDWMVPEANKERVTVNFRTNAVYDILGCTNIGVELQTGGGFALLTDYTGAWWHSKGKNRFLENYGFQVEGRYYIGTEKKDAPFWGHHVGAYAQMVTFDYEFGKKGRQSANLDDSYGIGVCYGYSRPLTRSLSADFTIGAGFFYSRYDEYNPKNNGYVLEGKRKLSFIGPTRIEATLVWHINNKIIFAE